MLRVRIRSRAVWEILTRRNMTQNDLAKVADLGSGHLSQIINGERFPSPPVRQRLLDALAPAKFDEIFEIEDAPSRRGNGSRP